MTLKRIQREISDLMKEKVRALLYFWPDSRSDPRQDQLGGISLEPTDDLFVYESMKIRHVSPDA